MYDAIVVGARCAGSATALLLARKGYRVLLVDKAVFPSDTISGHFILHRGTVRLKRWGLLDKVLASNCPPITKWSSNFGDFTLTGQVPLIEDAPSAVGPRRTVLDNILLEAAVDAGVEVRQGFAVTDLLWDKACVVGIRGRTKEGSTVTERAQIVIGADGKHSKIAQLVQAPTYMELPSLTCWYYTYWSNFPCDSIELNWRPQRVTFTFPTNDGLTMTALGLPHRELHSFRSDIEGNFRNSLHLMTDLAARSDQARREERFYAMADVPNFLRKPYGLGWALIGDAGHHKDPTLAFGMSDAFCDAELLVDAIHQGLSGEQLLDEALAQYEQKRNARAIPDHEENYRMAHLEGWDAPEVLGLRAALRGNEQDTAHFCAIRARAVSPETFFSPENLQRIMMRQATRTPEPA